MGILESRIAIVTGASSGIGRACALRFAEEGAAVIACARRRDKLDELVSEIASKGGRALAVECDVAKQADIERVVSTAGKEFDRIDILANIAQGGIGKQEYLCDVTPESTFDYYRTGPLQSLLFMQACFPYMKRQAYGRIINTGSHNAINGSPGFTAYAMAKGSIQVLTRVAAKEWGKFGIVTNLFLPLAVNETFFTASDRGREWAQRLAAANPLGRLGSPYEDCSPILAFMASEGAGYLNGQAIGADGGNSLVA